MYSRRNEDIFPLHFLTNSLYGKRQKKDNRDYSGIKILLSKNYTSLHPYISHILTRVIFNLCILEGYSSWVKATLSFPGKISKGWNKVIRRNILRRSTKGLLWSTVSCKIFKEPSLEKVALSLLYQVSLITSIEHTRKLKSAIFIKTEAAMLKQAQVNHNCFFHVMKADTHNSAVLCECILNILYI